ncbi:MAG: DEAD/DEAH box helicase [Campylobacterales bacterium]
MAFSNLGLNPHLLETLAQKGYTAPTEIQTQVIPVVLRGRDVLAAAQTGTGKTAAYALPILHQLMALSAQPKARALVVVPTRELASQIAEAIAAYAEGTELRCVALYGGANISQQAKELANGVDVIVATPGRLLELNKQGHASLTQIQTLVFDEADTIFDMGFIREVEQLIDLIPPKPQTMLFSATLTGAVKQLAEKILKKPLLIEVNNLQAADMTLRQVVHPVEKERKHELLAYLIGKNNYPRVLVFTRTKAQADEVSNELALSGLKNTVIHGDKTHGARDRALNDFREGKARILVATDIAARGLDIEGLEVVINFDIPHVATDYLHRIGRTGRAGKDGVAITLLSTQEYQSWSKILVMLGKHVQTAVVEGFEPPAQASPVKTRGKSMSKAAAKKGKTPGAFGNKRKTPAAPPAPAKPARPASAKPSAHAAMGKPLGKGSTPRKTGGRGR